MLTRFETTSAAKDEAKLSGVIYTPDAPTAVLNIVHGFGEHSGRYAGMMDHLGEHGIATVAIDVRGHGLSEGPRGVCHKYENLHGDVDALLAQSRETFPDLPHFLFGHSMGGGIVLHYVLKKGHVGLSGIAASAPLITLTKPLGKPVESFMRIMRKIAPNMTAPNKISGREISSIPEEREAYENDPLNHGNLGLGLGVDMFDAGRWILDNAATWDAPLLLLHSRHDRLTSFKGSEAFAKKANNCNFRIFESVEHEMHNDTSRPEVYTDLIAFVEKHL